MQITVFGAGYVGLVQAVVFAEAGHYVLCIDSDLDKIEALQRGEASFYEPGLQPLVERNLSAGRISFSDDIGKGVHFSSVLIIAVGTPQTDEGEADISQVLSVSDVIAEHAHGQKTVLCKSTVPVGTCDVLQQRMQKKSSNLSVEVVSNPEFLKQGDAVNDCIKPSRIVVGTLCEHARQLMRELYAPFCRSHDRLIFMDRCSAEMAKYASNCFLATKISFMNEMANFAEKAGADIEAVRQAMGADPRIGYQFIYPGIGYGGSCFPKDVKALAYASREHGLKPDLMDAVDLRNTKQVTGFFEKISQHFDHKLEGRMFALWGLAFKPGTSDMRESPARYLLEKLWQAGARVQAHDPQALQECQRIYGNRHDLVLSEQKHDVVEGADALIICSEWSEYRSPDFDRLKHQLLKPVIFDGRNLWSPDDMGRKGFLYCSVGRPVSQPH